MKKTIICLFAIFAVSFGFALRDEPSDSERSRFARDAEAKKPFAFAFAKRGADDENIFIPRFARDLDEKSKFAFAFAKRSDNSRRYALNSEEQGTRFAFTKRGDEDVAKFARFA